MPGIKRARSSSVAKRPEGCPLTCPVPLWNYLVDKKVWSAILQTDQGPGPWEVRAYQGPTEVLVGTEQYAYLQKQFQLSEKRRIQLRLREVERYIYNKPYVGPVPTAAEIAWANFVERERRERRRKRNQPKRSLPIDIPSVVVKTESIDAEMDVKVEAMQANLALEWQDPYTAHTQRPLTPLPEEGANADFEL